METPTVIPPEVVARQNAFSSYALESYNTLESLKKRAVHVIVKLSNLPTKIEDIVESEKTLKECKAEINAIKSDRLAQTSKLDKFFENFMAPEKQSLAALPGYEQAIIKLKNEKSLADSLQANKDAELKKIKETFLVHINNTKASHEQVIIDYVTNRYAYALKHAKDASTIVVESNDMPLSEYLMKCQCSKKVSDFAITQPIFTPKYATPEQINQIWNECESVYLDGKLMQGKFEGDLKDKFKYFSVAFKDTERAIAHSEKVANEAKEQATANAEQMNVGAKLATNATVMNTAPETKALKVKYEIDMESSKQNAMLIMSAFASNLDKCENEVRVKDWMKLDISQMGSALAALKNKDEKFEVTGINFKVTQKL